MPRADFSNQTAFDYDDYPPGLAYRQPGTASREGPRVAHDDAADGYGSLELYSAERVGAPLPSRAKRLLRRSVFAVGMIGAGYATLHAPESWRVWASDKIASLTAGFEASAKMPSGPPDAAKASVLEQKAATPPPLTQSDVAEAPAVAAPVVVAMPEPVPEAAAEAASGASDSNDAQAAPSPLPPPLVNPADPLATRAVSAGLHPGLSRALLTKLTPDDFHNAQVAIQTALVETPDAQVFAFPKPRKAGQALFEVHFVPGAPADCRRYVVTVAKDRWLTTALPMEKCTARSNAYSAATKRG